MALVELTVNSVPAYGRMPKSAFSVFTIWKVFAHYFFVRRACFIIIILFHLINLLMAQNKHSKKKISCTIVSFDGSPIINTMRQTAFDLSEI